MGNTRLQTSEEHEAALDMVCALMGVDADIDELDALVSAIEEYEDRHFPIELPDPITAIKFRMEQQGLSQSDLAPIPIKDPDLGR